MAKNGYSAVPRGYAPAPVKTALHTEGIVAFGAELTNCFCVGKGQKAFLSQHIGDLQGIENNHVLRIIDCTIPQAV